MVGYARFVTVLFFALSITVLASGLARVDSDDDRLTQGMRLVEEFYHALLSEESDSTTYSPVFYSDLCVNTNASHAEVSSTESKWIFLRKNRNLFLTERYSQGKFYEPADFFKKAGKSITFYNPPQQEHYSAGLMYVTLVSTTANAGKDGIYKEISFPIVPCDGTDKYAIEFYGIKINGILIDPNRDFLRDYDLWDRLGFRSDRKRAVTVTSEP